MAEPRKPKIEEASTTHKRCVFADKEFTKPAQALAASLGVSKDRQIEKRLLGDKYYLVVGDDGDRAATESEGQQIEKLAVEFSIKLTDVLDFMNSAHKSPVYQFTKPRIEVDYWPPGGIIVKVPPDATKQDFINQWRKVKILRSLFEGKYKPTKRKPSHNYALVYAIFRQRANRLTFSHIFRLYKDGNLPLYSGSNNSYQSEDSLERYYRKHKPKDTV